MPKLELVLRSDQREISVCRIDTPEGGEITPLQMITLVSLASSLVGNGIDNPANNWYPHWLKPRDNDDVTEGGFRAHLRLFPDKKDRAVSEEPSDRA